MFEDEQAIVRLFEKKYSDDPHALFGACSSGSDGALSVVAPAVWDFLPELARLACS